MRWKRRSINQEEDRNKERCRDSFSHRCSVPSLFSSFPENTGITLFLLPVIFGSVCSDFSSCNYYNYHSFGGTGETEIDSLSSKIFSGTDRFDWNVNDRCGKKVIPTWFQILYMKYSPRQCATLWLTIVKMEALGKWGNMFSGIKHLLRNHPHAWLWTESQNCKICF